MVQKVFDYVQQNNMLTAEDVVAAGISGGADSVCLLFLLTKLRERLPFKLLVVHVNHGIRKEADSDEAYVKHLCEKWQVSFFSVKEDVRRLAEEQGISEEEAGRNLRYISFNEILKREAPEEYETGKVKIAVAHNQNDRAETMLFNLVRGTGLKGLCSIQPVRDIIIRPLLCLTREEIEEILKQENIDFCIDCTNAEDTYTRNKIRNKVFPYITQEISPAAIERMNHAADLLTDASDYIRYETDKAWSRVEIPVSSTNSKRTETDDSQDSGNNSQVGTDNKQVILNVRVLLQEHPFVQGQLILTAIERVYPGKKDITSAHVQAIKELCSTGGSKQLNLPYGILVKKQYDSLIFERQIYVSEGQLPVSEKSLHVGGEACNSISEEKSEDQFGQESMEVNRIPGCYYVSNHSGVIGELEFKILSYKKDEQIPQNKYTKWFDYDKIDKPLFIRKRRGGDYLTINDELSRKSLKSYLIDEKIPKDIRDDLWVLAEEDHILWVIGHRISTKYKIDENTKRILQVQLKGGASWQSM